MNFQELYRRIESLDRPMAEEPNEGNAITGAMADPDHPIGAPIKGTGLTKTKQLPVDEEMDVESCGSSSMSSPPGQQDTVSMSVNMNGSGAGGIRDLMSILKNIDNDDSDMPHMDISTPSAMSGDLGDMHNADDDEDALSQIMRLSGKPTMLPGNDGMDGVDKPQEGFANEPDENYSDISTLTHDHAGGLNAPHKQYKKEYPGDNPMAESVKNKLLHKYQSYK